jgi:hypothetical protein
MSKNAVHAKPLQYQKLNIPSTSRQEPCLTQHVNFIDNDEANLLEPLLHHQAVEKRVRLLHGAHVQRALVPPFLRREPAAVTAFNNQSKNNQAV